VFETWPSLGYDPRPTHMTRVPSHAGYILVNRSGDYVPRYMYCLDCQVTLLCYCSFNLMYPNPSANRISVLSVASTPLQGRSRGSYNGEGLTSWKLSDNLAITVTRLYYDIVS